MYWSEITVRLSLGISTPRIRGIRSFSLRLVQHEARAVDSISLSLTLALLVAGVGANHVHFALAAHNLAVFTDSLDTRSHFHDFSIAQNDAQRSRLWVIVIPQTIFIPVKAEFS
jgi:hypothetical protein